MNGFRQDPVFGEEDVGQQITGTIEICVSKAHLWRIGGDGVMRKRSVIIIIQVFARGTVILFFNIDNIFGTKFRNTVNTDR